MFKNVIVDAQSSPVQYMFDHIVNLPILIAPTKREYVTNLCKDVTLRFTDDLKWMFCYVPADKTILISKRAVEILWCIAFGYFSIYAEVCQKRRIIRAVDEEPVTIDLRSVPEIREALSLLQWAFEEFLNDDPSDWPANVDMAKIDKSPTIWQNAGLMYTMPFLMLHEIYHHACGHQPNTPPEVSIQEEQEADRMATEFILDHLPPNDSGFLVRGIGMVVALMMMIGIDIHRGEFRIRSHPRSFDRLFNSIERFLVSEPDHHIWLFALCLLMLHIDNSELKEKLSITITDRKTFRGMVNDYINALAEVTDLREFFKLIS